MKSTTAVGSGGTVLFLTWLWNEFGVWAANDYSAELYPILTVDAAAGLLMLLAALGSRFLDQIDRE